MENSFLNQFSIDPEYMMIGILIAMVILMIAVCIALVKISNLKRKLSYFMQGRDAENLEDLIIDQMEEIRRLKAEDRSNKDAIRSNNRNFRASFQKLGIVKYNAFKGMGGNLSTAIALLDYTNSGFILNCVHSREGCFIYVKSVDVGQTEIVLGSEEQEALEQAMGYKKFER